MTLSADPVRLRQVTAAVATWRGQLIDLSWRNQLLYYKNLRYGTLDFADADPGAVAALLAGNAVRLSRLVSRSVFADRHKRVRAIRNKAQEAAEERGIAICHVAVGMATWRNTSGTASPAAPVLLREASIIATGAAEEDFELTVVGEPVFNPALAHVLAEQFKLSLDTDALLGLLESADSDPEVVFEELRSACAAVTGFRVQQRRVLGTFSYTKLPMVEDLSANFDALVRHDVVAAIAGNQEAARAIASSGSDVALDAPDHLAPDSEFLVLDADSSQQNAIDAVLAGQSLVVSGPPGTGKSQTIANMITSLVANGQTVLFVAEKRAAIAAVLDRLAHVGLGDLTFDVQDGGNSRAAQIQAVTAGLHAAPVDDDGDRAHLLARRRTQLRAHDVAVNERRQPWNVSMFEAQSALLRLRSRHGTSVDSSVRFGGTELGQLDADTMRQVREQLSEYATLGGLTLTMSTSPWAGAEIDSAAGADAALQLAARIRAKSLPEAWRALDDVAGAAGIGGPTTIAGWRATLALLSEISTTTATLAPEVFAAPLPDLIAATAPRRSLAARRGAKSRKPMRAAAFELWTGPRRPSRKDLNDALRQADSTRTRWSALVNGTQVPTPPANLAIAIARADRLAGELAELAGPFGWVDFAGLPRPQLTAFVDALAADERTARKLPRLSELASEFRRRGLDPLLAELRARRTDPDLAAATFETCWYESILERVAFEDPVIAHFDGSRHDRHAAEFRTLDAEHIAAASARVRNRVAARLVDVGLANPDQGRLVAAQAARTRGQLPLRQLFAAAPDFLTALKPCWAMSPLLVSQILPGDRTYFDVVVFDEASQIVPADAIAAIARADRVVVAGDRNQLPPTQFFAVGTDDGGESAVNDDGSINLALTTGFESILDVASAALTAARTRGLHWHYRSRDERLIAFSNSWVYGDEMVTFPGVAGRDCLSLDVVRRSRTAADEEGVAAEVDRVVARILDHAANHPDLSLGVITMGINHMERIDRRLRERLKTRPKLRSYFDDPPGEAFFVKNLERVQGDERDAIILSIGYGKRPDGTLSHNFGPLNQDGGQRRLNVAITRARKQMTVVSSFSHRDMDPERCTAAGVAMLRAYLAYAAGQGESAAAATAPTLTPFDVDVRNALTAAGVPVDAQFGVTAHRIDFAAADPRTPGAMALAIEADGPHYHSAPTVRDRDRLRQDQLGRLGWSYHRIWVSEWFGDRAGCIARAQAAYLHSIATDSSKPPIAVGRTLADYSDGELVALLQWIARDRANRSEDELLREFLAALGFAKAGIRIRARFDRAAGYARLVSPAAG